MRLNALVTTCALTVAACECGPLEPLKFACQTDDDCARGFPCVGGVCGGTAGSGGGAAAGGGTATGGGGAAAAGGGGGGEAGGLGGGAAGGTAGGMGAVLVVSATIVNPVPAGSCLAVTAQTQRDGVPVNVQPAAQVSLSVQPAGAAGLYSNAGCTTAVTSVSIRAMRSDVTFYVKPQTAANGVTVTAATPGYASGSVTFDALGAVRRGTCAFGTTAADGGEDVAVSCTISPPQLDVGHTLLVFTTSSPSALPHSFMIRCRLTSATAITCDRARGTAPAQVSWQTLELPSGLSVQRVQGACSDPPFSVALPSAAPPGSSFVTRSTLQSSVTYDDDEGVVATLGGASIDFDFGAPGATCSGAYEAQVATLSGLTVVHGQLDAGLPAGQPAAAVSGLPVAAANDTALLVQARVAEGAPLLCPSLVRASMPDATSIAFSRGLGSDGGCVSEPVLQLDWQRLDFGARAQVLARGAQLGIGALSTDLTIPAVDPSRTLVVGSAFAAGLGGGETDYALDASYPLAEANARLELTSPTNVHVERAHGTRPAAFTFFVIELNP